ncbi:MAG: amidohydrolase [bacterium]|nr:amidohydrolase [bacterium]
MGELLIRGAAVYTVGGEVLERGDVLIREGRIAAVGTGLQAGPGAAIREAGGLTLTPGLIDAHAHVGIWEDGLGWEGNDTNEITDPLTPHLRAIDGVNHEDQGLRDAVAGGVTAVWCAPGSANVIGGEGATIRTHGCSLDDLILKAPSGLKAALGENPKRVYSQQKKMPSTRMASAALLRDVLVKAQNYLAKQQRGNADPDKAPERDLRLEAVARVLKGEIPLRMHAHRADDIFTALRIAAEFGLTLSIEHCTEGHKIADHLARRNVPAVVGPTLTARMKVELKDRSLATPGILARAGVKVALCTDHPVMPVHHLPLVAAMAIREGMDETDALRAVTINAAEIAGVDDRLGTVEPGKDADLVLWTGPPFGFRTRVAATIMRGEVVFEAGGG